LRFLVRCAKVGLALALLAPMALPAVGIPKREEVAPAVLNHLSQIVQYRYYLAHPDQAPVGIRTAIASAGAAAQQGTEAARRRGRLPATLFNDDDVGFPQNEESIAVCTQRGNVVIGATNDYRGLLDPQGNFTGWHLSLNGGRSIRNEGLLPPVSADGQELPSGGDPVVQVDDECNIYAASINHGATAFEEGRNAIGLYRTTPQRLASCPRGEEPDTLTHPECWPTRRAVAFADVAGGVGQFLDKEWFDVGESGEAGKVIWVAYADFAVDINAPLGFTGAEIEAVRCNAELTECTEPIVISGTDEDVQFADVTISESGWTLITWAQIEGELEQTAQTFTIKARLARPGSTTFGPTRIVARETLPIPFGGFLHANDFRVATYPKSIMPTVGDRERIYVTWDRCRHVLFAGPGGTCEEPEILLSHSDNVGRSWSKPRTISAGGDNYFPAISDEVGSRDFVIAWYTNRFDRLFHNQQDVEMVTVNAATGAVRRRQRVTPVSNETEADPLLGGFFIGDYFDVHLRRGTAYVNYNANYRHVRVLGEGFPIPQQDNFLIKVSS
jgi:hypothetical protein